MTPTDDIAFRLTAAARRPLSWVQLLKFGIVGLSGYLLNLAVFVGLSENLGLPYLVAAVGAFCLAVTSNYQWNRYWAFGPSGEKSVFDSSRYLLVSCGTLLLNLVLLVLLVEWAGIGHLLAQAVAVAVAMPFNFLGNRLWTLSGSAEVN